MSCEKLGGGAHQSLRLLCQVNFKPSFAKMIRNATTDNITNITNITITITITQSPIWLCFVAQDIAFRPKKGLFLFCFSFVNPIQITVNLCYFTDSFGPTTPNQSSL